MLEALTGIDLARLAAVALLVTARVAPLTEIVPWIAVRGAPRAARLAVLGACVVALVPVALPVTPDLPTSMLALGALALREATIGAVFAVATAVPLVALDHAGRLVDAMRGGTMVERSGATEDRSTPLGDLHLLLGSVLFLALGGHRLVIAALGEGVVDLPPGSAIASPDLAAFALGTARIVAHALTLAAAFAAPAAIALIALEVLLGVVARAAPGIPVHVAGMPLRAVAGLAAVLLGLSVLVPHLPPVLRGGVEAAGGLVRELAP